MRMLLITTTLLLAAAGVPQAEAETDVEALEAAREDLVEARRELERATRALEAIAGEQRDVRTNVRSVIRTGSERPIIGVVMGSNRFPGEDGVRINAVTPGGPAAKAGVESGDTLLAVDGQAIHGRDAVRQAQGFFRDMDAGDRFVLTIRDAETNETREVTIEAAVHDPITTFSFVSDGSDQIVVDVQGITSGLTGDLQARMDELDFSSLSEELRHVGKGLQVEIPRFHMGDVADINVWRWGFGWSGLELARLNQGLGRYFGVEEGALVLDTEGMEDTTLLPGDVIMSVSGRPVANPNEVMRELRRFQPGETVDIEVVRDGGPIEIAVTVPEGPRNAFFYEWSSEDEE